MTKEEVELMKEDIKKESEQGFGRWGWFGVIHHLAKEDITKFDEVCEMELILVLNVLSYEKEKANEEKKLEQQNKK